MWCQIKMHGSTLDFMFGKLIMIRENNTVFQLKVADYLFNGYEYEDSQGNLVKNTWGFNIENVTKILK